jgi:glycosyltransferase involved in cell wall biosynthesis
LKIGIVAPPFIPVPPKEYGGTELFIAHLAEGLRELDTEVVVYTNGESTVNVEKRWLFERGQWPIRGDASAALRDIDHTTWALQDAATSCDIVHLNNAPGLSCSRFLKVPFVYTVHHPTNRSLSAFYGRFPEIDYVCISNDQRSRENLARVQTIHHGIDLSQYRLQETKQPYLSFIGRIAPIKGTHLAIEIAKKAGIPLKIAGEVQPINQSYFETKVKPHVDGKFIEYIGMADLAAKNELLGQSMAMLFPIKWDEPFGLVMIEAMACGTPVLAFQAGSVPEIVRDGVSGYVGRTVGELANYARELRILPGAIRMYVEENFSVARMCRDYRELYAHIVGNKQSKAA